MSAVIAILLGLLGLKSVGELPKQYLIETKDGIYLVDPAIADEYSQKEYDYIKENVYTIQSEVYPGGFGDSVIAD